MRFIFEREGLLENNYLSQFAHLVTLIRFVFDRMTVTAKQLKVVERQADVRIVYVVRRQMNLMMHDHARRIDSFGKTSFA